MIVGLNNTKQAAMFATVSFSLMRFAVLYAKKANSRSAIIEEAS